MRVLIGVHQSLPRWLGGAEICAFQLAQSLNQLGHTAAVFTRDEGELGLKRTVLDEVVIYRCFTAPLSDADKFRLVFGHRAVEQAFAQVLEDFKPEVVNFHHLLGLSPRLPEQAARQGLPVVLTLHDYWYVCANTKLLTNHTQELCAGPKLWLNCSQCGAAKLGPAAQWIAPALAPMFAMRDRILRGVLQRADCLIAPSRFLYDTYTRLGAPPERMRTIEEGIHPPPLTPLPIRANGPLRVLFIGSILPMKGLHVLIDAFRQLPSQAELAIVGDPQRDPEYNRQLRDAAFHPGIRWIGPVARSEVWTWFNWADVVVVPSLWYENAPLVIQESLAMRRPVLASRLGSLPEWVRDGLDGALFSPGDSEALHDLLNGLMHDRHRLQFWQSQIRPVRTMNDMAHAMVAVYDDLISRS